MEFEVLKDYTPQKIEDNGGFPIIDGTYDFAVNFARLETYDGDDPELQGVKSFRYELEGMVEGKSRKLWKRFSLNDEKKMKKLADLIFTLFAMDCKNEDQLLEFAEKFSEVTLLARCWGWTPPDSKNALQMHIIKGVAEADGIATETSDSGNLTF